MAATKRKFDLVCIGRGIADLYADQIGGPLEDAVSFSVYVGGSAANICVGAARLGLDTAMVLRVGDDHLGRLLRRTMANNGVDVTHVVTDPERPTGMCVLGVRDRQSFPRDLFSSNCSYLGLSQDDLDPELFENAGALLINGTFFATPELTEVSRKAIELAKRAGCRLVLDVDYRPALWGLVGHGEGEQAYVESAEVSERLQQFVPAFDLIVGTEEEICITGNSADPKAALKRLRELTDGLLILKRGPRGCIVFDGPIPEDLEQGLIVPSFEIELMNTAGAGDSYMAGFLAGWLRDASVEESCRIANACGGINVARHGCSDSAPSAAEIETFLERGGIRAAGREPEFLRLHRATNRWPAPAAGNVTDLSGLGSAEAQLAAAATVDSKSNAGFAFGPEPHQFDLSELSGSGRWLARELDVELLRPGFAAGVAAVNTLRTWPRDHILRLRAHDGEGFVDVAAGLAAACAETRHELAVDLTGAADPATAARALAAADVFPDWWIGPAAARDAVLGLDAHCRGYLASDAADGGWSIARPSDRSERVAAE